MKEMVFNIYADAEALSEGAADFFSQKVRETIEDKGHCSICLSGGSTPKAMFEHLASASFFSQIAWESIHIFWGDERCVPFDSPDSNARMAFETLLDHVPIPAEQIHTIHGELEPSLAAQTYEEDLKRFFQGKSPAFDLIFLGLGGDGHTASLFPYTPILDEDERWVKEVYVDKLNTHRISLTAPFINRSDAIAFLVSGEQKAAILHEVLTAPVDTPRLPAQLITTGSKRVRWLLDEAAAQKIKGLV